MWPLLLLFVLLIVAGSRLYSGDQQINSAAASAARAASLQSDPERAAAVARDQAAAALAGAGLACSRTDVTVDTDGFNAPAGQSAVVVVDVSCTVSWSDLAVPGLPGTKNLTATAVSPLDIHREVPA